MADIVPGYVPVATITADRLPGFTAAPEVPIYACLECGALVASVAEAGTLAHNNFHRELNSERELRGWDGR
jgi:hypothetical protein